MVILLTTFFLSAVVQLTAGVVFPWHRSILPPFQDPGPSSSSTYKLDSSVIGEGFLSFFKWETEDDPTHGRVNYVNQGTALERRLVEVNSSSFIMRADDTTVVSPSARGRDSNRITSYKSYEDSVMVLDVQHMPFGCATWPAFWTVDVNDWPKGGEIDIIEGVNVNQVNLASLHTGSGCTVPQNRVQQGSSQSTDCSAYDNGNQGCGTAFRNPESYGAGFNKNGGGWYVMKRTQSDGVYIWFWARGDPRVPLSVRSGGREVTPDASWGTPDARFPSTSSCDFSKYFNAHQIVFDTTFCGDWAGGVFSQSCGTVNCASYVDNNPGAFSEAYWEINALHIYTPSSPVSPVRPDGFLPFFEAVQ